MLDNIKKYFVVLSFFQFCFLSGALIASDEFREEKRIEQKSSSTTIATDSFLALEELKKTVSNGDVILLRGRRLLSFVEMFFTSSQYSHIGMILDAEKSLMMHSTPGTFGIPNIRPLPGEDPLKDRGVMVHNLEQVLQCGLYTSGILLKIKKPIRQEILEGIYAKYAKIPYENSWLELAKPFISRFYIQQFPECVQREQNSHIQKIFFAQFRGYSVRFY